MGLIFVSTISFALALIATAHNHGISCLPLIQYCSWVFLFFLVLMAKINRAPLEPAEDFQYWPIPERLRPWVPRSRLKKEVLQLVAGLALLPIGHICSIPMDLAWRHALGNTGSDEEPHLYINPSPAFFLAVIRVAIVHVAGTEALGRWSDIEEIDYNAAFGVFFLYAQFSI